MEICPDEYVRLPEDFGNLDSYTMSKTRNVSGSFAILPKVCFGIGFKPEPLNKNETNFFSLERTPIKKQTQYFVTYSALGIKITCM